MSHPSWVCGLKQLSLYHLHLVSMVTPFVGVWIETDVWNNILGNHQRSHPSWVCGLKLSSVDGAKIRFYVTPFVGVWIETWFTNNTTKNSIMSHPSWVCGLKLLACSRIFRVKLVTPFVGVWIETALNCSCNNLFWCHTLRGCVDWNSRKKDIWRKTIRHTLRGCVEWNRKQILFSEPTWKSHFYENVPLIVNKLQWQKIWFGTSLSGLSLVLYSNL